MNKYQEALDKLRTHCLASPTHAMGEEFGFGADYDLNHDGYEDETDVLQELVDKATPRKPKRKLIKSEDLWSETVTVIGIDICDNCKEHVQHSRKFCDKCGQALDWSRDDNHHR